MIVNLRPVLKAAVLVSLPALQGLMGASTTDGIDGQSG